MPCGGSLRAPTFTIVTILTIALSVEAITAIGSVGQAVLLHPAGIQDPERLASFHVRYTQSNLLYIGILTPDPKDAPSLHPIVGSAAVAQRKPILAPW